MKGWEIARLVRQIDPAFPVVYITGAAADDWASEGINSILLNKPLPCASASSFSSAVILKSSGTALRYIGSIDHDHQRGARPLDGGAMG